MPRNRMIKVDFWSDAKVAKLSHTARLLMIGIWNYSDDGGVCRGDPLFLRNHIFSYDDMNLNDLEECVVELCSHGFMRKISHHEESYLYIPNFKLHQKLNRPSSFRYLGDKHERLTTDSRPTHDTLTADSLPKVKVKEKEKVKEKVNGTRPKKRHREKIPALWNQMAEQCGLSKVLLPLSEVRGKKLDTAFKQIKEPTEWLSIMKQVPQDDFRMGKNNRGWKANFDWLFRNENYLQMLEEYNNENGGVECV